MPRKSKATTEVQQQLPINRAVIYLRVSTEEQAEHGFGLDAQLDQCQAYARAFGLDVVGVFTDDGISGTKGIEARPALADVITKAKAREFDYLITASLDRLARAALLLLTLWDEFERMRINVVCVKERIDTSTPAGRLMRTMIAGVAEFERDSIVARTTAGRNERGKRDGEKGGRVPMGYVRSADGEIAIDLEAARIVRRIFDARDNGDTLREIAGALNASGLTTARGHGWHASSVREVLLNEDAYKGGRRGDSAVCWQPILTTEIATLGA